MRFRLAPESVAAGGSVSQFLIVQEVTTIPSEAIVCERSAARRDFWVEGGSFMLTEPMILPLDIVRNICAIQDERGKIVGTGTREVCEVVVRLLKNQQASRGSVRASTSTNSADQCASGDSNLNVPGERRLSADSQKLNFHF